MFEEVVGRLEARAEQAEAALSALVPVAEKLGGLAGDVLPDAVAAAVKYGRENALLNRRVGQAERDASLLTTALVGDIGPRILNEEKEDD